MLIYHLKNVMKKTLCVIISALAIVTLSVSSVSAKKLLPFLKKATGVATSTSSGVVSSVKFRGDRLGIIVTFGSLQSAYKVDYFLSYQVRGITQGASGSITDTAIGSATRDIIFGSCSKGVCRYDSGISNAKFVITIYLNNGRKIVRSYKLNV